MKSMKWMWPLAALMVFAVPGSAQLELSDADRELAHELYRDLIAIPSVSGTPETVVGAEMLAERLLDAGFEPSDVRVLAKSPTEGNLVVRLRGSSSELRPVLVMAHLDVVTTVPDDWQEYPFTLLEKDGFFLGRGTGDNKAGVVHLVANFIRFKREGYTPLRDVVAVITGDEETTSDGIKWLLAEHRDLIDAEFALNTDSGGGALDAEGNRESFGVQASEKMYTTFHMTTENSGGHSSRPRPDNAIYQLARAITKIEEQVFPITMDEVTRGFFEQTAATQNGQTRSDMLAVAGEPPDEAAAGRLAASSPYLNAVMRTTCVATRLQAGHADNALPRDARATVNCRIFPGLSAASVQAELERVIGDPGVTLTLVNNPVRSPASQLADVVMAPVRELVDEMFGEGLPIIPEMSAGATDGNYVRNAGIPVYGLGAMFSKDGEMNAHGLDEKVRVESFFEGYEFWYRLMKRIASPSVIP